VGHHADRRTCHELMMENLPAGSTPLYTDEWQSYRGSHPAHSWTPWRPRMGPG
jgi:hypothetical protein